MRLLGPRVPTGLVGGPGERMLEPTTLVPATDHVLATEKPERWVQDGEGASVDQQGLSPGSADGQ